MFEIGTSLREARLRQSLEFPEIEQATKIRGRYLRALEEEQFDTLPASTYVKGFLRTYADYLGMDGQLYVDEYNSRYIAGEEEPPLRRSSAAPIRYQRRVESRVVVLALGAIGVATALVIAAWKFGGAEPTVPPSAPATHAAVTTQTRHRSRPRGPQPVTLILTAKGSSYVKIRLKSNVGRQVYAGTMEAPQANRFYSKRLWIAVSDPQNLRATLNGKVIALPVAVKRTGVIVTSAGLKGATGGT